MMCNFEAVSSSNKAISMISRFLAIGFLFLNFTCHAQATKIIHVFVALCDNKYQGIVPVPTKIGNGQDPDNNLYWGCAFGVRFYFNKSKEWKLIRIYKRTGHRLERIVFKHTTRDYYLVADAYDGQYIKQCTIDFLNSCAGKADDTLHVGNIAVSINGNSSLVAYVGHDGLMDFQLTDRFENVDGRTIDCIILACISKKYFAPHLKSTRANPLVWSTGLMSPEAYTLHDALSAYVDGGNPQMVRTAAAKAYSKYQKCSERAARNLLVSGW